MTRFTGAAGAASGAGATSPAAALDGPGYRRSEAPMTRLGGGAAAAVGVSSFPLVAPSSPAALAGLGPGYLPSAAHGHRVRRECVPCDSKTGSRGVGGWGKMGRHTIQGQHPALSTSFSTALPLSSQAATAHVQAFRGGADTPNTGPTLPTLFIRGGGRRLAVLPLGAGVQPLRGAHDLALHKDVADGTGCRGRQARGSHQVPAASPHGSRAPRGGPSFRKRNPKGTTSNQRGERCVCVCVCGGGGVEHGAITAPKRNAERSYPIHFELQRG
jgi:hypothetical protein